MIMSAQGCARSNDLDLAPAELVRGARAGRSTALGRNLCVGRQMARVGGARPAMDMDLPGIDRLTALRADR